MDQIKIGEFLKELRKEKNMTQEQLADKFFVSRRTVSRWETGSNMPDLDVLVELADFYDVDLRDIFNGQRRESDMNAELKDTLLQAADYTNDIKKKINPRTKGIVIINPNNPTGALYPEDVLKEIVKLAEENDLIIFSDEIYDRLVMDGAKHTSIASMTDKCLCLTFNGLSKSHLIAGYRVGWVSLSGDKSNAKGYIEGLNLLSSIESLSIMQ